jgi:S-phase kinase-associated protein 1
MQEQKSFDEKFVRINMEKLCELASSADSIQLMPILSVECLLDSLVNCRGGNLGYFHLLDNLTEVRRVDISC